MVEILVNSLANVWPAPAKLNLMLRVLDRRPDGYHNLQTVFQIIDLCDWLVFEPWVENSIRLLVGMGGVDDGDNLVVRAASLLKKESGYSGGVGIRLEKRIPVGAGLGGGSSDAATTLLALNRMWGLGLQVGELCELGITLGADVPVFVRGRNAWAEGVGERLTDLELPDAWFVIIKPEVHISTPVIFGSNHLTRDNKPITIADFTAGWSGNDCLGAVVAEYPIVRRAMDSLSSFGDARLTGTGACVFVELASRSAAYAAARAVSSEWQQVFVARAADQSPALLK